MFPFLFRLATRRLLIRRMHPDDWRDLYAYLSDPETVLYEPYDVYTKEDAMLEAANRANSPAFLAVCLQSNGKMIGNLYFARNGEEAELGYVFHKKYRGRNYAFEACSAIIAYAFKEPDLRSVYAECDARNLRSRHLMERLGMTFETEFSGPDFTGREEQARSIRFRLVK